MTGCTAESETGWYLRIEKILYGPYTSAKVRRLLLDGEVKFTDEISQDRKHWRKLQEIPEVVPVRLRAQMGDRSAQTLVNSRQFADIDTEFDRTRQFPLIPLSLVSLMLLGVVVLALWNGMPDDTDSPDCSAPAAPGVNWRNCVFKQMALGSTNLAAANMNSAVLQGAVLTATELSAGDLRYADLRRADLSRARLRDANLQGANLQGADLTRADLSGADLRFADLTNSRLHAADLSGTRLRGAIWYDGRVCSTGSVGGCRH